jgi:hypothetical protein
MAAMTGGHGGGGIAMDGSGRSLPVYGLPSAVYRLARHSSLVTVVVIPKASAVRRIACRLAPPRCAEEAGGYPIEMGS